MTLRGHGGVAPSIDATAFVAPSADLIGDVAIGAEANVWFGCVLRGDVRPIRVGARSNLQDGTIVHGSTGGETVRIGADVTVGHGAILHGCTLEDGCFVGMRAVILDRATVRSGGMVAAGAVVTPGKTVPAGELWAGSPARLLRPMTVGETDDIAASAARYVALSRSYR